MTTETVRRKFVAVRRDITSYVDPAWMARAGVAKVYDVLIYDPERRVHCCSLSASWELVHVYHTYDLARELTGREQDELSEEVLSWDVGGVEYWSNDPAAAGFATRDLGEWEGDDDAECEADAIEHERCNPSF